MREIKFRAWDKINGKMLYSGSFTLNGDPMSYAEQMRWFFFHTSNEQPADDYSSVMQYTGLKDKNGKEIYEGDIVNVPYGRHKYNANDDSYDTNTLDIIPCRIVFQEYGGFVPKLEIGKKTAQKRIGKRKCLWGIQPSDYEVIGNIYEHPELLK